MSLPDNFKSATFIATGSSLPINIINSAISFHTITWQLSPGLTSATVALDSSMDGITWTPGGVVPPTLVTANGVSAVINIIVNYVRITVSTYVGTPTSSITVTWDGYVNNPATSGGAASTVKIEDTTGASLLSNGSGALQVAVVSGGGSNASVGLTGAPAPTSATEVGVIDGGGNLQGASATHPVRVDPTGTTVQPVSGTVTAVQPTGTNLHVVADTGSTTTVTGNVTVVQPTGTNLHVVVDSAPASSVTGTLTNNNAAPAANNIGVLPNLANAVSPLWTEGDQVLGSVDLNGGQRTIGGNVPEVTAAWTSATAANTVLQINTLGYSTVNLALVTPGTASNGFLEFEVSDTVAFTNAYQCFGVETAPFSSNSNAPIGLTSSASLPLTAGGNFSFLFNVTGWAAFRVRLVIGIMGAGTTNLGLTASSITTSLPTVGIHTIATPVLGASDNNQFVTFITDLADVSRPVLIANQVFGGRFAGTPDSVRQGWLGARTPTVFNTASVAATATGNTAVWTPGAGNKFRLLGFQITAQGLAATSTGVVTVSFQDSATPITFGTYDVDVPAVASVVSGTDEISGGFVSLGQFGILSAAVNNALNFNISAAGVGTVGTYRVNIAGTEE